MYVCLCNRVTDRQLIEAAAEFASTSHTVDSPSLAVCVADRLGAGLGCGSCREFALDLVERAATQQASVVLPERSFSSVLDTPPSPHQDLLFQPARHAEDGAVATAGE